LIIWLFTRKKNPDKDDIEKKFDNIENICTIKNTDDIMYINEKSFKEEEESTPPSYNKVLVKPKIRENKIIVLDALAPTERNSVNSSNSRKIIIKKQNRYKTETYCCKLMEEIFDNKYKFNKARPDWLINPDTGQRLELDCYNEELEIGLEFNGIQHYIFPNPFHRTEQEFNSQIKRDQYKKYICSSSNVMLIVVPYTIPKKDIKAYILESMKKLNHEMN